MKPLLCVASVVRNLLNLEVNSWPAKAIDSSKPFQWQDRRPIKNQPIRFWSKVKASSFAGLCWRAEGKRHQIDGEIDEVRKQMAEFATSKVGEVIYVREAFYRPRGKDQISYLTPALRGSAWEYCESTTLSKEGAETGAFVLSPPMHLPEKLSRIHLEVMRVRVERACDISRDDAMAEGVMSYESQQCGDHIIDAEQYLFRSLWEKLYGPDAWEKWVWVYDLKRIK